MAALMLMIMMICVMNVLMFMDFTIMLMGMNMFLICMATHAISPPDSLS